MRLQRLFVMAAGLLLLAASPGLARKWTDLTGKFSVEAELVEIKGDQVVLKRSTGAVITVPLARLSEVDRQYLQSLGKPGPKPPEGGPATQPAVVPQDETLAADLKKGGTVTIRANGEPVANVLVQIEKATGNRIRIVDQFGGDDKKLLAKRVSLNLPGKPFWEAVEAMTAAAGVKFRAVKHGVLELSTEGPQFDKIRVLGPPTAVGAFQVYPGFDDFFDQAMVVVRSEPRFGEPQLRGYHAEITLPGGKQIQYKPDFLFSTSNVHTGELTLRIKDLPAGTTKAQEIKLEVRLAIASDPQAFTLPPLGELLPKSVKVGSGAVYVTRAELDSESSDRQTFAVELVAEGLPFDLKDMVLVDTAGNRVSSAGGGGSKQDQRQNVTLRFPRAKISGDASKSQLVVEVPGTAATTIGPLGDVAARPVPVGAGIVRITKADLVQQSGRREFEVRVEFDGFPLTPEQVALVGPGSQSLQPTGYGSGGNSAQFWFDPAQIRGKAESYRLTLQAPTKSTEHILRSTFRDVPLAK
jgi:hypothetical protein